MAGAVVPPVAPRSPVDGGAAPHFSAKLGAWVSQPEIAERAQPGFRSSAAKRRNYGNVSLSQRGKVWLAIIIYCAAVWSAGAWVWCSYYGAAQ